MTKPATRTPKSRKPRAAKKAPTLSRLHPPDDMSLPQWQVGLRRQFGRAQAFVMENLGDDRLFSDFRVANPASGGRYRVAIRGAALGANRCDCGDYATNELGTCKHIEFVLARLERQRGAKAALRRGCVTAFSELWLQHGAQHSLRLRVGSAMPAELLAAAHALFEAADGWRLPDTRFERLPAFVAAATHHGHDLRIAEDAARFIDAAAAAARLRLRLTEAYPNQAADAGLRELLREPLFPYQLEGALFAAAAGRALIADEMGLGKTVQAIAAAELWRRHGDARRVLVVCPTSLKAQWAHELQRFAGRKALIVEGNVIERANQYAAPAEVKIVSYDALTRDLALVNAWQPDVLIVDEAQRVKNWNTLAARALKRLDSRFAVVLTGTPLENRLEELLSVVQLVDRQRLGPTWRFLHEHQLCDDSGRVTGYRQLDRIGQTLAPILIRRHKKDVLQQLPARSDRNLFVALTPLQQQLHDEQADVVARIVARWRKVKHLTDADQKRLQAALQKMRMVCNSSYLLDRRSDEGSKIPELMAWLQPRLAEPDGKAVIFSAWIGSHELIAAQLDALGIGYVHFNGSVAARERARRVERFRDDPGCRVFLATDAGGVGLNLQHAASIIVNLDLPWNPAVLEQRIGRVYRMGQQRRVEVLNLVASASIEENMLGVLSFKRALFEGALDGGAAELHLQGTRLSRFMRSVEALTAPERNIGADAAPVAAALDPPPAPAPAAAATDPLQPPARAAAAAATDPLAPPTNGAAAPSATPSDALKPLLQLASAWLGQIASALDHPEGSPLIERDPASGRASLRQPLPEPDVLRKFTELLQAAVGNAR